MTQTPDPTPNPPPPPSPQPPAKPGSRSSSPAAPALARQVLTVRRRKWLRWVAIAILAIVAVWALLTRSPLTRAIVLPQLARALQMDVAASRVKIDLSGRLVLSDATVRVPGVPGPAGQVVSVRSLVADIDWIGAIRGRMPARSVELIEPVVVISQSIEDRSLNLGQLVFKPSGGGPLELPTITLVRAAVELGEHTAKVYTPLKRMTLNGRVTPGAAPGSYAIALRQASTAAMPAGVERLFRIEGTVGPDAIEASAANFSLSDWPPSSVPTPVRAILQDLELAGDVPSARFSYTPATGVVADLQLRGVALNLPLQPDPTFSPTGGPLEGPPTRLMRMSNVNGSIVFARDAATASLAGLVEDLPYQVKLRYLGTTVDAPFELQIVSENFRIDRNPALLPYAPEAVRKWLRTFSSPTALVTARVNVDRGPPSSGGNLKVSGVIDLRQGTAAFERFPYGFVDIDAQFKFDNTSLEMTRLKGRSPSGGAVEASARIAPLDDTAEVRVKVEVRHAPIDAAMEQAFGPGKANIIQILFNTRAYQQLIAQGLVRTPADAQRDAQDRARLEAELPSLAPAQVEAATARLAQLVERERVPIFTLGGLADIDVNIFSPLGRDMPWTTTVDIRIPEAGLVPEKFPYPVRGRNVVARVVDENGLLISGEFEGIAGGAAKVAATFGIPKRGADTSANPDISIEAIRLPFDARAIHALPSGSSASTPSGEMSTVKRILTDLRIDATVSGTVRIAERSEKPGKPLGFDVNVGFDNARLAPLPFESASPVVATALAGKVRATEDVIEVGVNGTIESPGTPGEARPAPSPFTAQLLAPIADDTKDQQGSFVVRVPSLDLAMPAESIAWVFSKDTASALRELSGTYTPRGAASLDLDGLLPAGDKPLDVVATIRPTSITTAGIGTRRVELGIPAPGSSAIKVRQAPRAQIEIERLLVPLRVDGQPAGTLDIAGVWPIGRPALTDAPTELRVGVDSCSLDSPLVAAALDKFLSARTIAGVRELKPRGVFDAQLRVATAAPDPLQPLPASARPLVTGTLSPRSLAFELAGQPVEFPVMEGTVEFDAAGGVVRRLVGRGDGWWAGFDGGWSGTPEAGFTLRGQLSGRADSLRPGVLAVLPRDVREVIDQISLQVNGPLALQDMSLTVARPASAPPRTDLLGTIEFQDAQLDVGVPVTRATGSTQVDVSIPGDEPPRFAVSLAAESLRALGVRMTDVRGVIRSGAARGEVEISDVEARVHGGRATVAAQLGPALASGSGVARQFDADVRLAGVLFKPLLDDLDVGDTPAEAPGAPTPPPEDPAAFSRGVIDGSLAVTGRTGDPASRRGRGDLRIARKGAKVLDLPVLVRLVEVSNLQLPLGESIDLAQARFYIDGPVITFDDVSAYSRSVSLLGYGTMTLPGLELNLRFNSKSARPVPILSALVQGIRDEFVTAVVGGTLTKPDVRLSQFSQTRRMISRGVGNAESDQTRRLSELERRAVGVRQGESPGTRRIAPASEDPPPSR